MSEERSGAPLPKPEGGVSAGDLGHPASGEMSALDETGDGVRPSVAPDTEPRPRPARDSSPGARRRGRTLRIPDDEVVRPDVASRSAPPPAVRSAPPPAVLPSSPPAAGVQPARPSAPVPPAVSPATPSAGVQARPSPPVQLVSDEELTIVKPSRIITINPVATEPAVLPVAVPPTPPAPDLKALDRRPVDDGVAAKAKPVEDSWTPHQPMASDERAPFVPAIWSPEPPDPPKPPEPMGSLGALGAIGAIGTVVAPSAVAKADPGISVDEDIPIDTEGPVAPEPVIEPAPETPPPVTIEPEPDDVTMEEGERPTPIMRALLPTEPEGVDVRFDDDVPTPAVPPVAHAAVRANEHASTDGDRRSDPGAEIAAEDLVAVEPVAAPGTKTLANLPPMRPRLESKPSAPPTKKPAPAAPKPGRPPLVIVPPHVGTMAPQSDLGGARRKGRLWWEDLFNDDYLRTCERLTDEQIAREVDFVEDSLSIERGGAVLDLACGTGRHAVELARRGYEVVGFDLSLAMLARAGDEAQDREAKLNFIQGDMREMTFEEQFDGVYCWNTSFGYFEEEKNALVIERIHRALKSEGLLLLDVVNRDFLIRQSPSLAWFEGDGCVCMDEMNVDFITSRMKVKRTIMLDDGRSREIEYSLRVYSLHELGRILHEHGFKVCEVSGRIATPSVFFGNESPRTIILAEKR